MHVVDSIFVGRLGAAELGALGFAGVWLWTVMSVFSGRATGVQTFVSQRHGAGDEKACGGWLWQGLYAVVPAAALGLFAFAALAGPLWSALGTTRSCASTRSPTCTCDRSGSRASCCGRRSPRSSAASATRARRSSRRSSPTCQRGARLRARVRGPRAAGLGDRRRRRRDLDRRVGRRGGAGERLCAGGWPSASAPGPCAPSPRDPALPAHGRADRRPVVPRHGGLRDLHDAGGADGHGVDGGDPGDDLAALDVVHAGDRDRARRDDAGRPLQGRRRPRRPRCAAITRR